MKRNYQHPCIIVAPVQLTHLMSSSSLGETSVGVSNVIQNSFEGCAPQRLNRAYIN